MFTESMKTTIPKFPVDTALVIVKIVIKKNAERETQFRIKKNKE